MVAGRYPWWPELCSHFGCLVCGVGARTTKGGPCNGEEDRWMEDLQEAVEEVGGGFRLDVKPIATCVKDAAQVDLTYCKTNWHTCKRRSTNMTETKRE